MIHNAICVCGSFFFLWAELSAPFGAATVQDPVKSKLDPRGDSVIWAQPPPLTLHSLLFALLPGQNKHGYL